MLLRYDATVMPTCRLVGAAALDALRRRRRASPVLSTTETDYLSSLLRGGSAVVQSRAVSLATHRGDATVVPDGAEDWKPCLNVGALTPSSAPMVVSTYNNILFMRWGAGLPEN